MKSAAKIAVSLAAFLVPASYRKRFREEWHSELWHRREKGSLVRSLGAFPDALATRRLLREERESRESKNHFAFSTELRLAIRSYVKRPFWTAFVLLTLAVSIGANTAIGSLVNAVLLQPLRYQDPDRLVKVQGLSTATSEPGNLSPADFYDFASETTAFEAMGAHGW
ncbi:MAG: hypothetical protein ACRD3V_30890, partial [Vicinamibacteria bacterium]